MTAHIEDILGRGVRGPLARRFGDLEPQENSSALAGVELSQANDASVQLAQEKFMGGSSTPAVV